MSLLKEYISLIIKEAVDEDVNLKRLHPGMLGIYALAQAINKLIYEGDALPGALPIDIIDSGKDLKHAPMATDIEKKAGMSLQHTRSSFKLYIDPTKTINFMHVGNETHDLIHTITGHIARAIARRRPDLEASGRYGGTPSRFNKITLKKDEINDFIKKFKKVFGYELPFSVFEKVFEIKNYSDYSKWFGETVWPNITKKSAKINGRPVSQRSLEDIGSAIRRAVYGQGTVPGIFGKRYWADTDITDVKVDVKDSYDFGVPGPGKDSPLKVSWKQSMEDEEMLGNIINATIQFDVREGKPIRNVKRVTDDIMNFYKRVPSPSHTVGNIEPQDYKLRFDTPEARSSIERLLTLYNQMLQRYTVGLSTAQPSRKQLSKKADVYDRKQVTSAERRRLRRSSRDR